MGDAISPTGAPRANSRHVFWWTLDQKGRPCAMSLSPRGPNDAEYVEKLHELADEFGGSSWCYFIGGNEGAVKIGHAVEPGRRLRELQNACPIPLGVIAQVRGGELRECAYHHRFAAHRLHGEWFERCPEIEAEIERLNRHG